MAYKTMTAETAADTKARTVRVTVTHNHFQSYSRAVKPRAFKEFKKWCYENIMFGETELSGVDYHNDIPADPNSGDCKTTYIFSY